MKKNNECPVCGAMAEPFRQNEAVRNVRFNPMDGSPILSLTRCKNCNAAFWQDEEPDAE